jgi:putative intracellular protease/amidase
MSDTNCFPRTLRIGILVFDKFEPIDVWGFAEALAISRYIGTSYGSLAPYPFEVVLIANQCRPPGAGEATPKPVKSNNGPRVAPDYFRDEALEEKFDVIMIPGGIGTRPLVNDDNPDRAALVEWVQAMDQRVELMTSVCTGAAILAFAGVLDGRPAATNHEAFAWVTSQGTRVLWDNVSRWVDAGHYVTSAGVSAGTDMGFYLVKRLAGRAVAEAAAIAAEYGWHDDPERPIYHPQQAAVPGTMESK